MCAPGQHGVCCMLQALVASIEGTMRESRESLKGMDTYKAQLHRIWPKEDVQHWVTSFNECMQQAQSARDAALDLARNKGQVFTLLLHAAMTSYTSVSSLRRISAEQPCTLLYCPALGPGTAAV